MIRINAKSPRRPVRVLRPDEDHAIAAEAMRERRIKRLPIAHNGKVLGIVSLSDLAGLPVGRQKYCGLL